MKVFRSLFLSSCIALVACGGEQVQTHAGNKTAKATETKQEPPPVVVDLGPRPEPGPAKPFTPPVVETFQAKNGMKVWLAPRRGLPLVSMSLVIEGGSSIDPSDKPGLMHITTDMLDEGAGKRSAIEISGAVSDLGASLSIHTGVDASTLSVTVLKKNFSPAFSILADVVARPKFDAKEFKRVSELWRNDLKSRPDEPSRVARVVNAAVLYGPGTPYGHPSDGLLEAAEKIDLTTIKKFYAENIRPDRAVLVVAGDITRSEVEAAIDADLGSWKAPKAPAKKDPKVTIPGPRKAADRPKIVLVDRPKAPQSVIAVVREGLMASEPDAIRIDLVNTPLGGSFTSRLNQNLREEKHWAYGARTAFLGTRGKGAFWALASVETPATGPALKETLRELEKMAKEGPTAEEVEKAKAQDRADMLKTFETISDTADRLASLAQLGLPPTYDAEATRVRQSQKVEEVAALAKAQVDPASATIIVVGPKEAIWSDLMALGLGEPALWDAEGKPVVATAAAKAEEPKDKPKGK